MCITIIFHFKVNLFCFPRQGTDGRAHVKVHRGGVARHGNEVKIEQFVKSYLDNLLRVFFS
jgi:hypothetical protein